MPSPTTSRSISALSALRLIQLGALIAAALPAPLAAQAFTVTPLAEPRPKDPTYALPLTPTRTARFTTDEGTWMSVDVSPDGKTILFDLLGDLYTVPIAGGDATRIMGGMAMDVQPRYSPDGTRILFVSDRSGADNIWIADADGRNPHPLTRGVLDTAASGQAYMQPTWAPDGRFIFAGGKRYDVRSGVAMRLPEIGEEVAFGGSARYAYFASYRGIAVYDLAAARATLIVNNGDPSSLSSRRAFRPVVSRDDRWLVYGIRIDGQTSLRLRDLRTGEETWLARDVQRDAGEWFLSLGRFPNFAFTPDSRAIVVTTGGKLWRVEVPSGRRTLIPFRADVELDLGPLSLFQYAVPDSLTVRQIREPRLSPDGKRLAFIALDKLYLMDFPHGTPRRATTAVGVVENYPTWSPDGRYVAFTTYHDLTGGHIYRVNVARVLAGRRVESERLTREADLYTRLAYTPDGRRLVFGRSPWRQQQQLFDRKNRSRVDLFWMGADGDSARRITRLEEEAGGAFAMAAAPHFLAAEPDRLVVPDAGALISMRWDGSDRRTLLRWNADVHGGIYSKAVLSPDGTRAIVLGRANLYLVTLPPGRTDSLRIDVTAADPPVPLRQISRLGAEFPGWSADGKQIYFALGRSLFAYDVATAEARVRDSLRAADIRYATDPWAARADSMTRAAYDTSRTPFPLAYTPARYDIQVVVPRDRARGTVALRGARLITMKGSEVIPRGDLVIRDGRIVAVGPSGAVTIPRGARVIDGAGKTILPGYVDIHFHVTYAQQLHKTQMPQYLANLAYGVTTTRDPSPHGTDVLTYGDRVDAGDLLGPRILSTGTPIGPGLLSLAATRELLRRYAEFYETQTLKQYGAGNRKVRQWIIMAARELGLTPTTEGSGDWKMSITEMLDGYAGHEHNFEIYPLYRDAALLAAASGITYTPTLVVNYGGPEGKNWWFIEENPHDDPKLRRFSAHADLDDRTAQLPWAPEARYIFPAAARGAATVVAAGGHVGLGMHGELHGLGTHWELWMLGSGGMPNHEVLRAGTLTGARAIGLDREVGSLEPGKLADLQILDGNPLEHLRYTNTVRYVMKSGRLYDANTLDEVWPRRQALGPQWWQVVEPPADMVRATAPVRTAEGRSSSPDPTATPAGAATTP